MDILIGGSLLLIFLLVLVLNIYCIVDISKRKPKYQWKKMAWLNLIWAMLLSDALSTCTIASSFGIRYDILLYTAV